MSELSPRLRLRYSKLGKVRFTSQRDLARIWERTLRRVRLPVAYSSGFSPHPLLAFSLALPTGAESLAEYLDLRLDPEEARGGAFDVAEGALGEGPAYAELCATLTDLLPEGLVVEAAAGWHGPMTSLQEAVTSCSWELEVGVDAERAEAAVAVLLDAREVPLSRERKGRVVTDDVRPVIRNLQVRAGEQTLVVADLWTKPRGLRPQELTAVLGSDITLRRARRTKQWIDESRAAVEPLTVDGVLAERAVGDRGHPA